MSMIFKHANLSDDEVYRFDLKRIWAADTLRVLWVMLNPSTADADLDDPTIRRCMGFSKAWGYGGMTVVNLFDYRATDPKALTSAIKDGVDISSPANDHYIVSAAATADAIVCAWGANANKVMPGRAALVHQMLWNVQPTTCLGLTKAGDPKHPLYLGAEVPRIPFLP